MRPDIPPEPVQSDSRTGSPCSGDFKDTTGYSETCVCRHYLCRSNPLCHVTSFTGCDVALIGPRLVDACDGFAGPVRQRFRSPEVCLEVAVPLEDVELVGCLVFVVTAIWPCSRFAGRIL